MTFSKQETFNVASGHFENLSGKICLLENLEFAVKKL